MRDKLYKLSASFQLLKLQDIINDLYSDNIHARVKICYMVKNIFVKLLKYLIYESEIIRNKTQWNIINMTYMAPLIL